MYGCKFRDFSLLSCEGSPENKDRGITGVFKYMQNYRRQIYEMLKKDNYIVGGSYYYHTGIFRYGICGQG